jgi:hypothetical protein
MTTKREYNQLLTAIERQKVKMMKDERGRERAKRWWWWV